MTFTFGRPVVADAGPDQTSNASGIYYLDCNASYDPDIDGNIFLGNCYTLY